MTDASTSSSRVRNKEENKKRAAVVNMMSPTSKKKYQAFTKYSDKAAFRDLYETDHTMTSLETVKKDEQHDEKTEWKHCTYEPLAIIIKEEGGEDEQKQSNAVKETSTGWTPNLNSWPLPLSPREEKWYDGRLRLSLRHRRTSAKSSRRPGTQDCRGRRCRRTPGKDLWQGLLSGPCPMRRAMAAEGRRPWQARSLPTSLTLLRACP